MRSWRLSVDPVAGLLAAWRRRSGLSRHLYDVLVAPESGGLATAKAELFACLRRHLGVAESKALTLKLLNLYLAKQHFRAGHARLGSRPLNLVVDPSNSCNLACPGCAHSTRAKESKWFDWTPGVLGATRFGALLDRYGPTALFATLYNHGEPTVNPGTPMFIRRAKAHLLQTVLSTNLSLPDFDAPAYVESGLDYMVLSIDGATQPVYERFRRKGNLELVFQNILNLVEARRALGRVTPVLSWRFLVFEHNIHEIPAAIETARGLGVDQFEAVPGADVSWDAPDIRATPFTPLKVGFGLDIYAALASNWNPFPQDLDVAAIHREFEAERQSIEGNAASTPDSTCEWLYKSLVMDAGGRIFPCCCSPEPGAALTFAEFAAGTGADVDVFNSSLHRQARRFFADAQSYRLNYGDEYAGNGRTSPHPHCVVCPWDKAAFPGRGQMRNYFGAAAPSLFNSALLDLLSTW